VPQPSTDNYAVLLRLLGLNDPGKQLVWLRYWCGIAGALTAVLLRTAAEPLLHDKQPFAFSTVAVILSAIYLGIGPALLSLAISLVLGVPLFISPYNTMELNLDSVFAVISYTIVAASISLLAYRQRIAKEAASSYAFEVARLNEELENRVRQRTAELEEANGELAGFTYSIAHDMRQFLRGINVATYNILEDQMPLLDAEGRESLTSLGRNARQASLLVDGLLEFARLGKNELNRGAVDVTAVAAEVAAQVARSEHEAQPQFEIQAGVTATADWRLLQIVLQNLMENAVKYRSSDIPKIHVGALREGKTQVLFVRDDGIGFDMKFCEHIFLPFERLHRHVEYPGTGIGLANVKRIVEKHGGRIWAESSPGGGAVFYFTLEPEQYPSALAA
jgi:signal transduction histidine kinase